MEPEEVLREWGKPMTKKDLADRVCKNRQIAYKKINRSAEKDRILRISVQKSKGRKQLCDHYYLPEWPVKKTTEPSKPNANLVVETWEIQGEEFKGPTTHP